MCDGHLIITVTKNPSINNLKEEGLMWVSDFIDFLSRLAGSVECVGKAAYCTVARKQKK